MQRLLAIGWRITGILTMLLVAGCGSERGIALSTIPAQPTGLNHPFWSPSVKAIVAPPDGWKPRPLIANAKHTHEIWVSPTHETAYGVMHFALPLPVGPDLVLWGFMRAMRQKQGSATLISSEDDPSLPGIRFVAEGGKYKIRVNLTAHGWEGWAVYAATLRGRPANRGELFLAEKAREFTVPSDKPTGEKSAPGANDDTSRSVVLGYDYRRTGLFRR